MVILVMAIVVVEETSNNVDHLLITLVVKSDITQPPLLGLLMSATLGLLVPSGSASHLNEMLPTPQSAQHINSTQQQQQWRPISQSAQHHQAHIAVYPNS